MTSSLLSLFDSLIPKRTALVQQKGEEFGTIKEERDDACVVRVKRIPLC